MARPDDKCRGPGRARGVDDEQDLAAGRLGDPEAAPSLPSATLAAAAAPGEPGAARARYSRSGTSGEIWKLSWPVMLSQLLVTAVSLIDIAMVGRLGPQAVAAVGYATQFFFMGQSALFAVGFACVALVAKALGGGDREAAKTALAASFLVALGTALLVTAAVLVAPRALMEVLGAQPRVIELTLPFLRLVMGSTLLLSLALMFENGLRADRDTVTAMRVALVVTVVKVALNFALIFGMFGLPRLELVGAGLATVVSQLVALALFVLAARGMAASSPLALSWADFRAARRRLGEVVRIAAPGVAERIMLNLALLSYFAVLGRYGTVAVAAYTVGVRLLSFSWIPGTGFAAAVAALVGQALGAGDEEAAQRIGWRGARLALVVAVILGLLCGLGRHWLAAVFTDDVETIALLGPFMLCLAIAQPVLQLHFTLGGAHRGAGDTWTPLVAAAIGNWGLRVPLAFLFAVVFEADLVWIWSALIFDHLARALWLAVSFKRGGWKKELSSLAAPA
ncbi:MAG: MATE family efflux transporter [Candidatus Binatia bacterium]